MDLDASIPLLIEYEAKRAWEKELCPIFEKALGVVDNNHMDTPMIKFGLEHHIPGMPRHLEVVFKYYCEKFTPSLVLKTRIVIGAFPEEHDEETWKQFFSVRESLKYAVRFWKKYYPKMVLGKV